MATTDSTPGSSFPDEPLSEPMRRVLEAMVAGEPIPEEDQEALTPAEEAEIAALARAANLTYLTLQQPDASTAAEERSLAQAQRALAQRPPATRPAAPPTPATPPRPALLAWLLDRLRGKRKE